MDSHSFWFILAHFFSGLLGAQTPKVVNITWGHVTKDSVKVQLLTKNAIELNYLYGAYNE